MSTRPYSREPLQHDYSAALRDVHPGDTAEVELGSLTPTARLPASDPGAARVKQQIETWRERLIDLTQRNPLLGLNRTAAAPAAPGPSNV